MAHTLLTLDVQVVFAAVFYGFGWEAAMARVRRIALKGSAPDAGLDDRATRMDH